MKKCIVLLLALVITASTIAACTAGVPGSSSSHASASSLMVSAPSSSEGASLLSSSVSSLSQSSIVSASTVSIPDAFSHTILFQDEECVTYQYNTNATFGTAGIYSFSITLPCNWYFDEMSKQYAFSNEREDVALMIVVAGKFLSPDELEEITPKEDRDSFVNVLDKGSYECSDGKLVSFLYIEGTHEGVRYIYDYSVMIEEDKGLRLIFYYDECNLDIDVPIQREIIESIKTIAIY